MTDMVHSADYISLQEDGRFLAKYGTKFVFTRSIFVAYTWVNRWLRSDNLPTLDLWEAQEIHWQLIGNGRAA